MMMTLMTEAEIKLATRLYLLQAEVTALWSVLSEWEADKTCYTQYVRAEQIRSILEDIDMDRL